MNQIKILPMVACFLVAIPGLFAQYALKDAITLTPFSDINKSDNRAFLASSKVMVEDEASGDISVNDTVASVLLQYLEASDELSTAGVTKAFTFNNTVSNPFLNLLFSSNSSISGMSKLSTPTPAAGGAQVTSIVDGIARFLVKRTKAELTLAFFEDFKNKIEKDQWLNLFFPLTSQMLLSIDSDVYQFQIYLDALRDAFISDLKALPGEVENYLRDNTVNDLSSQQQAICIDLLHVVQQLLSGAPPPDIFTYLSDDSFSAIQQEVLRNDQLKNIAAGLKMADLFSQSLFNPETGRWYPSDTIRKYLNNETTFRIYMGLLWHQANKINLSFQSSAKKGAVKSFKIADIISTAATGGSAVLVWKRELGAFGQSGVTWQNALEKSNNITSTPVTEEEKKTSELQWFDSFYRTLNTLSAMLESANQVYQLVDKNGAAIDPEQILLLQQIGGLSFNICRKHYSAAIANTAMILDIALAEKFKSKSTFLRYGSFIGAVADAESAEEVENALDMFALPPGSAKAKKGPGKFSVALNAYTGANAAAERFQSGSTAYGVCSVTAPLGFSLNWGQKWGKSPGSVGVFFPVIDVGAVFAYRFKNDDDIDNLPPLSWKNVIAPGAYFVMDPPIGKWPLTIGLGGQFGPQLRKVYDGGRYVNNDVAAYRIGGFIAFDIPINYLSIRGKK